MARPRPFISASYSALARAAAMAVVCLWVALSARSSAAADATKAKAPGRVAVLYFDYEGQDIELGFLRKGLAEILVSNLGDMPSVTFVERGELEKVIAEQDRGKSKRFDSLTTARIGKLLGAQFLVTGRFFTLRGQLIIVAKIIDVETGVTRGVRAQRRLDQFAVLEEELSDRLRDRLAGVIAQSQAGAPAAPRAREPRRSGRREGKRLKRRKSKAIKTRTVARYGKALDAIDRGDKKKAKKILESVVKEAPAFELATRDLASLVR